jgi:hypothetical protein
MLIKQKITNTLANLSERISARHLVPSTFRRVVAPNRWVECLKSSTLFVAFGIILDKILTKEIPF